MKLWDFYKFFIYTSQLIVVTNKLLLIHSYHKWEIIKTRNMKLFAGIAALGGANGIYLSELDRNGTLQELTR